MGDACLPVLLFSSLFSPCIATNDLSILKRKPSDLMRYIAWTNQTKAAYGSITNFILQQRLFWEPIPSSNSESGPRFDCLNHIPFAAKDDFKILLNDWPYGISAGITHLIVWSKVRLPDQKPEGFLIPWSTALVQEFVRETFVDRLAAKGMRSPEDNVLWFRNWTGLQSVRGLEHVHVLVRDAPKDLLQAWMEEDGV